MKMTRPKWLQPHRPKGISRWKGIETLTTVVAPESTLNGPKGISRWKGIETYSVKNYFFTILRPKGISRWKGIETL